jgi:hypothetical protein
MVHNFAFSNLKNGKRIMSNKRARVASVTQEEGFTSGASVSGLDLS